MSRATFEAVQRLNTLPIPTVALVQGGCFGGGTGIISACDVVIAADNALFSITEVRWGLTAAIIIPQLCDAIGVRQVRRYALTGERFGAEDARRIGLVHEVVPLADLEAAGGKVVEQLLANGPEALAETKALAMESSFGGMSVDDEAYARLVRMHSAKRQTRRPPKAWLVRGKARGEVADGRKLRPSNQLVGVEIDFAHVVWPAAVRFDAAVLEPQRRIALGRGLYRGADIAGLETVEAEPRAATGDLAPCRICRFPRRGHA